MYLAIQGLMPSNLNDVTDETVNKIRDFGFAGVACRYQQPLITTKSETEKLRTILESGGVKPCQVNANNPDLISTDRNLRHEGIRVMQYMCKVTRWLNADTLYLRPGSINPNGSWYPHPDNYKPESFQVLIDSVKEICIEAEAQGIKLAVEGHVLSILNTPEKIKEFIEKVGSNALGFNMDPVNFVGSLSQAYDTSSLLEHLFDVLGTYTISGHAKDFIVENKLVLHIEEEAIGYGLLDHKSFLINFQKYCSDGYLMIEHLPDSKILEAGKALYSLGIEAGVTWNTGEFINDTQE